MKKTSFFFILIFSVFFSFNNAFAQVVDEQYFGSISSGYIFDGISVTEGEWGYNKNNVGVCRNVYAGDYPSTTTNLGGGCANFDTYLQGLDLDLEASFGSQGNGNYWVRYWTTDIGYVTFYYVEVTRVGVNNWTTPISTPPQDTQGTYKESPYNGEVVATSGTGDVLVAFDYYLDTEQDPDHDTDQWCMRLVRNDGAGDAEYCDDVVFDTYTAVSHTFTGLALDSQWDWSIVFTRPGFFIDEYSILHAGSNYFFSGRFTIDSTAQEIYTAYTTCSITDLAGCFQNAIVFLFYPSQSSLNDFSSLYDAIKNKPPFGYISAVQTALQGINNTETSVFTLETMPVLNTYIFTPFRTALIWIMWLAFIFMFYHRLKNIHL